MPIVINGIKVLKLWYSPMADTGRVTFLYPFIEFITAFFLLSFIIGFLLYRKKGSRFILVRGPMRLRNVIKAVIRDKVGRWMVIAYTFSYFISYLITSDLLLIPGINVDSYFTQLTMLTYEGSGFNVLELGNNLALVESPYLMLMGIGVDAVLTLSLILSYYMISLIYVSMNLYSFPVPRSFRLSATSTAGGFLTASVPSLGTIAGICCLTPTAMNSLLYLASGTLPLTKGVAWKYGTFILGTWTGGILQALALGSTVITGILILSISAYYIYKISNRIANKFEVTISG